jgi:hypothetical protein
VRRGNRAFPSASNVKSRRFGGIFRQGNSRKVFAVFRSQLCGNKNWNASEFEEERKRSAALIGAYCSRA